mmetsp:Transcript_14353/g.20025  ORF Transcript_14353/g.20025 Transcript_14353/m.20025 type:complete len:242 (+) Transcript_14353:52-777(+)
MLGIIGGSGLLKSSFFSNCEIRVVETQYGSVKLHFGQGFVFCQRHQADPQKEYTPPHLINKKAILTAFKTVGVTNIAAFASVGSLKLDIPLGTLMVADDFFNIWDCVTFFDDARGHFVPVMENDFRSQIIELLKQDSVVSPSLRDHGTYVQTNGPRFETKSEIRFYQTVADVVGMTAAHEIILACELKIPIALICMVDNMANGIQKEQLTLEEFHKGVARNQVIVERVAELVLQNFAKNNN